jgi:hypothetical protein
VFANIICQEGKKAAKTATQLGIVVKTRTFGDVIVLHAF